MNPPAIISQVSITNGELLEVLNKLGYHQINHDEQYRFQNDEYDSLVVLPLRPLDEVVQKVYVASYSYRLYMQGVIKDQETLIKMVEKNRAKKKTRTLKLPHA